MNSCYSMLTVNMLTLDIGYLYQETLTVPGETACEK